MGGLQNICLRHSERCSIGGEKARVRASFGFGDILALWEEREGTRNNGLSLSGWEDKDALNGDKPGGKGEGEGRNREGKGRREEGKEEFFCFLWGWGGVGKTMQEFGLVILTSLRDIQVEILE